MLEENTELYNDIDTKNDNDSVFDFADAPTVNRIESASDAPNQLSPEWHDYVMSKFTDNELVEINGERYPNCYGLRRVVELLIGDIVESKPTNLIMSPDSNGNTPGRVTCIYEVAIRDHDTGALKKYGDVAEVFSLNCDDLFLAYPAATAVTRAEGRCLRKLLKVRCVAAEELTRNKNVGEAVRAVINTTPTNGEYQETNEPLTGIQIKAIKSRCAALDIDEMKFVNSGQNKYAKIEDIQKKVAIKMIGLLNDYQNNKQPIPIEILKGKE
jgi:hypothetical protein